MKNIDNLFQKFLSYNIALFFKKQYYNDFNQYFFCEILKMIRFCFPPTFSRKRELAHYKIQSGKKGRNAFHREMTLQMGILSAKGWHTGRKIASRRVHIIAVSSSIVNSINFGGNKTKQNKIHFSSQCQKNVHPFPRSLNFVLVLIHSCRGVQRWP